MIDWPGLLVASLWISGLALLLACLSYAVFQAVETGSGLRAQLGAQGFTLVYSLGFMFFCLGLAASSTRGWWETGLWLLLALSFAIQAWTAGRQARGQSAALRSTLAQWLSSGTAAALGLLVLALVFAILYAYTIRPWMQPDEPRHFEVALHVARLHKPVVYYPDRVPEWEQEIIADMEAQDFWWYGYSIIGWDPNALPESFDQIWGPQYGLAFFQQPLYYALAGGLLARWDGSLPLSDIVTRLRWLGALCLAFSLWGVYKISIELFPNRPRLALAVLAFAALWPSHLAANAAVNNDPLVEVFVVWAIFFSVRLIRRGPTLSTLTALLLCGVLALFTKRSGLLALGLFPLALILWGLGWARARLSPGRFLAALVILVAAAGATVAMFMLALQTGRIYLPRDFVQSLTTGVYWRELSEAPLGVFAGALLRTFVGWFGWMRVPLPMAFYGLAAAGLVVLFMAVIFVLAGARGRSLQGWQKRGLLLFGAAILAQLALVVGKELVYGTWRDGSVTQARYLYPVLPAFLAFAALAGPRLIPERLHTHALLAEVALLLAFNIYILAFVLYPFFWL